MILRGVFFKLDDVVSQIEKNIIFFRYLYFKLDMNDISSDWHYPIYVALDANSVRFYIEYYPEGEASLHYLLFSLPILPSSKTIKDDLNDELINLYDKLDKNVYSLIKSKILEKDKISDFSKYFLEKKGKESNSENYHLAILFLDFLYDFEFSNIFKHSPHYEQVEIGLKENQFFQALLAKYKYLYYKEILQKEKEGGIIKSEFKKAKDNWLKIIMKPEAEKIIKEINKWFDDIETEHLNALYK